MTVVGITPKYDKTNGWSRILPDRTPKPALEQDIHADWVVIGGGIAGLSAARRLAENHPQASVVILEAHQAGEGSQGRNAGFIIDTPHNVGSSLSELNAARDHIILSRAAISSLKNQVEKYGIQCDWDPIGKLHTAVTDEGINKVLRLTTRSLDSLEEPYEWFEGKALHERIGIKHFKAGIYTPGSVLVNPAALSRGLADHMPANVTLYEQTPVTDLKHSPEIVIKTPRGAVRAGKVILATHVFTSQLGFYRDRLIPLSAYGSLSRQLTDKEQATLDGLRTWGLTPANAFVGVTIRRTRDQRILIRQDMRYQPSLHVAQSTYAKVATHHQYLFEKFFPQLKGVSIEHTWAGFICLSRNGSPGFGELAPNVFTAVCDNGLGWTKGTISGLLIADKASGVDNPLISVFERLGKPNALPPRPFLDVGVRARFGWELFRYRQEA